MLETLCASSCHSPSSPSSPARKKASLDDTPAPQAVASKSNSTKTDWSGFIARSQRQQAKKAAIDWNDLGSWDTRKLLLTCLQQNEDFKDSKFLWGELESSSTGTSKRRRARIILKYAEAVAVAEDPTANGRYFHPKYMPKDEVEKDAFLNVAGERAASWAKAAKDEFYDRLKVKNNFLIVGQHFLNIIMRRWNKG